MDFSGKFGALVPALLLAKYIELLFPYFWTHQK